MRNRNGWKIIILLIAIIIVLIAIVFSAVKVPESSASNDRVTYNGTDYKLAPYRINALITGIDKSGVVESSQTYMNDGLADFICLLSVDIKNKECYAIHINRDTMTNVTMYGVGNAYLGKSEMQIALSHQYGDGLSFSCINTAKAVSELLGGINIDYYMSMNMNGISIINDYFGGVEVLIEDDFSGIEDSFKFGETVTLHGQQAMTFIRSRGNMPDKTNLNRMNRQKEFMNGLYKKVQSSDLNVDDLFNQLRPYIITNCSVNVLQDFADKKNDFTLHDISYIPGENKVVDGVMEYYADKDGLQKLIIDTFYIKTN